MINLPLKPTLNVRCFCVACYTLIQGMGLLDTSRVLASCPGSLVERWPGSLAVCRRVCFTLTLVCSGAPAGLVDVAKFCKKVLGEPLCVVYIGAVQCVFTFMIYNSNCLAYMHFLLSSLSPFSPLPSPPLPSTLLLHTHTQPPTSALCPWRALNS